MAHGHGGLLDDRPAIEFLGDEMGRGADQLHPPLPGPVIGLGALEGGEEGVVDVDHGGEALQKAGTEHLHVFGQDHQFNAVLCQQSQLGLLRLGAVGSAHR